MRAAAAEAAASTARIKKETKLFKEIEILENIVFFSEVAHDGGGRRDVLSFKDWQIEYKANLDISTRWYSQTNR